MPNSSVTGVSPNGQNVQATSSNKFAEMSSEEFVKLMITELSNQDPFNPNDTQATMEQLSSLRNIESQNELQKSLESMVNQQSISQAGSLVGYQVTGLDSHNDSIDGIVQSVRVVNGKAVLQLNNNKTLNMERITEIKVPQQQTTGDLLWDQTGNKEVDLTDYESWYEIWEKNRDKEPEVGEDGKIKTWQFRDGDFTGDGKIDIQDLTLLQKVFDDLINPPATAE